MKRIVTLIMLGMLWTSLCFAMSPEDIQEAIQVGQQAASDKKEFVYNEMDTDNTKGGFLGAQVKLRGRAYSQSPFVCVANKALVAKKNYLKVNEGELQRASNEIIVRVVLIAVNTNAKDIDIVRIVGLQGDKVIEATKADKGIPQIITTTGLFGTIISLNVGATVSFDAKDIDMAQPLIVKVITPLAKELTFKFNMQNYGKTYKVGSDDFKW